MTSNGRLAKLEGDLAMHKSFSEEVRKSQSGNLFVYCPLGIYLSSFGSKSWFHVASLG